MASDLWPPASYKMTLENSRPTACYFQWNSWKIWSNHFRAASLRSFLTSDLLLGDQNAWAAEKKYLCCIWASAHSVIKALSLFFVLIECTFSSIWTVQPRLDNYQTLAGQSRSRKMKILSRQRNFAIELCHLWAVLQMQHRTFILPKSEIYIFWAFFWGI